MFPFKGVIHWRLDRAYAAVIFSYHDGESNGKNNKDLTGNRGSAVTKNGEANGNKFNTTWKLQFHWGRIYGSKELRLSYHLKQTPWFFI